MHRHSGLMRFLCVAVSFAAMNVLAQVVSSPGAEGMTETEAILQLPLRVIQAGEILASRFAGRDFPLVLLGRMPAEFAGGKDAEVTEGASSPVNSASPRKRGRSCFVSCFVAKGLRHFAE